MVATRRGTVIQQPEEPEAVGTEISAEINAPAPQRQARGIKVEPSNVNQSEAFNVRSKRPTRNSSRIDILADGDVSEVDSTCSTHSALQTPSVSRTRSRQNVPSLHADSVQKNQNKKSVLTSATITDSQEEADVSEAESNCSSVYEVQRTTSRHMRNRQKISKFPKSVASECQPEEVSDSESCSSTVSAGQFNRVTRSRISKLQTEAVNQSQESNRDAVLQFLTKNKTDDVSDAESWCSGIAAGRPVRRLTRNSLARSQTGTESNPLVLSDSGFVEKLAPDIEQASVGSPRVLRSLRNRPSHQTDSESLSKSQSDDLKDSIKTLKVKRSIIVTVPSNQRQVNDQENTGSPEELLSQASEVVKDKCLVQNELEEVISLQPEHKDARRSPKKQKIPPKKGSKTHVDSQLMVEEITIDDDDDDCEITEVIAAVGPTTCPASVVGTSGITSKPSARNISELRKEIGATLILTSDTEIEVSDTGSEDEDVCMVENEKRVPSEESCPSGNDLFVIDKAPGLSTSKKYYIEGQKMHNVESKDDEVEEVESIHDETDDDFIDEDENDALQQRTQAGFTRSTTIDPGLNIEDLGGLYIDLEADQQIRKPSTLKAKEKEKNEEVLKHSIITADFEKKDSVPPYSESRKRLKKKRKEEQAKTTGDGWFGMRAPELTDELKNDLKALKMRSAINPKRFYKKNDREGFPKYFQVGTVVDNAVDFYHSRIPKNQRKRTIVEELLADSEFRRYNKKKYQEIMTEKMALNAGKKNRKKKKFRT